ncbi:MAG: FtsW/RodA/SpoVE family cell cycle protein [Clostridium sp.]|nr:FtsW/RodA/SpoVE family cell cycle protein [Clostridium sp.]
MSKWILDKRLLKQIDFSLIITAILISIFGVLNVYSTTYKTSVGTNYLISQIVGIVVSLVIVYIILLMDYSIMSNYSSVLYWIGNIVLLYTIVHSTAVKGATSWIQIGGQSFEPAGFYQVVLVLFLAKQVINMDGDVNKPKHLLLYLLYTMIPVLLIVKQPNLGEATICLCISLGIIFISKLNLKIIFSGVLVLIPALFAIWNSNILKAYQKSRITSFINPEATQQTTGYQLINSQIGIGSGQILGKGFLKGTQVSGGYIPEVHTDFIFAAVGEEWGLIGSCVLLLLYIFMLVRILKIGMNSKDLLGKLICVGTFASLLFSVYWNIGMTMGLAPIAGIPLPFMSHGNSFVISNFISLALVINVGMRKKKINF